MLLVASSKNEGEWVLPKGGWENDETQEEAAARETWEEGKPFFFSVLIFARTTNNDSSDFSQGWTSSGKGRAKA